MLRCSDQQVEVLVLRLYWSLQQVEVLVMPALLVTAAKCINLMLHFTKGQQPANQTKALLQAADAKNRKPSGLFKINLVLHLFIISQHGQESHTCTGLRWPDV